MKLTQSMLRSIHGDGKSHARRQARHKRETAQRLAAKEAESVYPGVTKRSNPKKYAEKLDFLENRMIKHLQPRADAVEKARKKLVIHLQAASARGRAAV